MVWFFEKESDKLQPELHFDRETRLYSIVRRESGDIVQIIHVLGEVSCRHLLQTIENEFEDNGWRSSGSPMWLRG